MTQVSKTADYGVRFVEVRYGVGRFLRVSFLRFLDYHANRDVFFAARRDLGFSVFRIGNSFVKVVAGAALRVAVVDRLVVFYRYIVQLGEGDGDLIVVHLNLYFLVIRRDGLDRVGVGFHHARVRAVPEAVDDDRYVNVVQRDDSQGLVNDVMVAAGGRRLVWDKVGNVADQVVSFAVVRMRFLIDVYVK